MAPTDTTIHGNCVDCGDPVVGGDGVTVDPEGGFWHADCRRVFNRKTTKDDGEVKRGPGRPRKQTAEATA